MEVSCPRCRVRHDVPSNRAGLIHCPGCASPFVTPPPRGSLGRSSLLLLRNEEAADQLRRTLRMWGTTGRALLVVVGVAWAVFLCGWLVWVSLE
jgi:hypothetical protein